MERTTKTLLQLMTKKKSRVAFQRKGRQHRANAVESSPEENADPETPPRRHRANGVDEFSPEENAASQTHPNEDAESENDGSDECEDFESGDDEKEDDDSDFGEWCDEGEVLDDELESEDEYSEEEVDEMSEIMYLLYESGKKVMFHNKEVRIAIGVRFQTLGFPNKETWAGHGGVVSKILCDLGLPNGSRDVIFRVLEDILECAKQGVKYTGEGHVRSGGRNKLIEQGGVDEQYVCDLAENGVTIGIVTLLLNEKRIEAGRGYVGMSAVRSAIKRANPTISRVGKMKQGSFDKNSGWAKASFRWVRQLLIRLGKIESDPSQPCFDIDIIGKLVPQQIISFDEKHIQCIIGQVSKFDLFDLRFLRDPVTGKLDENGVLREVRAEQSVKFANQGRFLFGVCVRELPRTDPYEPQRFEGIAADYLDYTEKTVVTIEDWDKTVKALFVKIKSEGGDRWIIGKRQIVKGVFYEEDPTDFLDGVGPKTVEKLAIAGINTIGDLKRVSPAVAQVAREAGVNQIGKFKEQAQSALDGKWVGNVKDCRNAKNPLEARYGPTWEIELKNCAEMKKYICITELVEHMVAQCKTLMAGTIYKDSWTFFHDALSLMTAKSTVEWMKTKGYYEHWLLPLEDLNVGTKYHGRPTGNRPEICCLDCTLFKDLETSIGTHLALTRNLKMDDPKRFLLGTPKQVQDTVKRLFSPEFEDGPLKSDRIVHDVFKCFGDNLMEVYKVDGICVPKLVTRNGQRKQASGKKRGGLRVKGPAPKRLRLHADAQGAKEQLYANAV